MSAQSPQPDHLWLPQGHGGNALIILLALLSMAMAWGNLQRRVQSHPQVEAIGLQGRVLDLQAGALGGKAPWAILEKQAKAPWDKALLAIHKAEAGDREAAARLLPEAPSGFAPVWRAAYAGGPACAPQAMAEVGQAIGGTRASDLLQVRLLEAAGKDASAYRRQARTHFWQRLAVLGGLGAGTALCLVGGAGFAIFLALKRPAAPAPLPSLGADGRSLAILFLSWFLVMQVSGQVVQIILGVLPFLRPWALTLAYLLHAGFATLLLLKLEGLSFGQLWRRMTPGAAGPSLAWGLGYLGLTVLAALALSLALSPLLPSQEPPQRELVEVLTKAQGIHRTLPLFLTVAFIAPCFEELMFRGCLIPALRRRLPAWPALIIGAVAFGAMHLQPLGLPLLSLLGLMMGLAFLRTGNLWTSILLHGCWNGAQFLLMRALYG